MKSFVVLKIIELNLVVYSITCVNEKQISHKMLVLNVEAALNPWYGAVNIVLLTYKNANVIKHLLF